MALSSLWGNEQSGPRCHRNHVNDWKRFETEQMKKYRKTEKASKLTGVDGKGDDWRHQDSLIRFRTDDPSSPDDDAIRDDKLTKEC